MRRKKRFVPAMIFLIIAAAIFFIYSYIANQHSPVLYPVFSAEDIVLSQEEDLHFFSEGWIVCGAPSRFYYWDQTEMLPPFSQDDLSAENGSIYITAHSQNYIVTKSSRIYDTRTVPFTLVYENQDLKIWDIKECTDFLILLIHDDSDLAQPYILVNNSDFLISMDGTGESRYISADFYSRDVSLLTLGVNSPFPITRVFHYINRNELYGVLTLENQFIYEIFRLKDKIILIGIKDILCYNIEGELQWTVRHESDGNFETIKSDGGLFIYFPEKTQLGDKKGNTLIIDSKGYSVKMFPKYLSGIKIHQYGYIALEFSNTFVIVNKEGKIIHKQRLQEPADELFTNSFRPEYILVRTKNDTLQIFSTKKQEEENQ
ncbi:MAG TPA: hypothetical protein GX505_11585 [Clostridiales bacterium]|nr:hypothetical protein [Clostridiales bacterium]